MSMLKWCGVTLFLFAFLTLINLYDTYQTMEKLSKYSNEHMDIKAILQFIGLAFTQFMLGFILLEIDTEPQPQAQPTPESNRIEQPKLKKESSTKGKVLKYLVFIIGYVIFAYVLIQILLRIL